MKKRSAGILLYRRSPDGLRLLLVHPGGPFWARKDLGAWSIPKGEYAAEEDPLSVARREFREELGGDPPRGDALPLGEIVQAAGKAVVAWALEGDFDVASLQSNTFELEWPPKSGHRQTFPEVDRAEWFTSEQAREKINAAQRRFIDRLVDVVGNKPQTRARTRPAAKRRP